MAGNASNDEVYSARTVLLVRCPSCYCQWLTRDDGQAHSACWTCGPPWPLVVTAAWTDASCPWGPWLLTCSPVRPVPVEPAGLFLRWLTRLAVQEHPTGPIGSHCVTPGVQLIPPGHGADCTFEESGGACTAGCRTTWTYAYTAGSDN